MSCLVKSLSNEQVESFASNPAISASRPQLDVEEKSEVV